MNFIEEAKGHNYQRYKEEQEQEQSEEEEGNVGGEEEEEEAAATRTTARASSSSKLIPFPSTSSSSNSPPFFYKNFLPHHSQEFHSPAPLSPPSGALNFNKKLDMMDLSLGNNSNNNDNIIAGTAVEGSSSNISAMPIEKEHMFDKVVTPSDVGKLNRLVIPKQHAEKYFPLDSVSNDKGLLLNFEDRNGKPWRFRYSYWNSSQSYVMTKGWSRFVKEKKLDAGDIVSFQRGVGEEGRHRLFIDWRRRPSVNPHQDFASHLEFPNQLNVGWGNRLLYSLPQMHNLPLPPPPQFPYSLTSYNVHQVQPYSPHYPFYGRGNAAPFYVRPGVGSQNIGEGIMVGGGGSEDVAPMVIDSVPVVQGRTVGKRLRLFGVNMDCPMVPSGSNIGGDEEESNLVGVVRPAHGLISAHLGSSTNNSFASYNQVPPGAASPLQLRLPSGSGSSSGSGVPMATMQSHELSKKGKSSLSFDLDL